MSYNSKKARKLRAKAQFKRAAPEGKAKVVKTGNKGPAKTGKVTKKRNTWFAKKDGKVVDTAPVRKQTQEDSDSE